MTKLAQNLRSRIRTLGMTQRELAEKAGISQVMVHKLLSGKSISTAKILDIANALQCQPDWLLHGKDDSGVVLTNTIPGPTIAARVPLISWVQAGDWTEIDENNRPSDTKEWRETTAKVDTRAFALRVQGDSMLNPAGFPSIPEGSIVIVDPTIEANSGMIVVAQLKNTDEATLKKLIVDGPNRYLKPLNPDYRPMLICDDCKIVGVVRQVISDL